MAGLQCKGRGPVAPRVDQCRPADRISDPLEGAQKDTARAAFVAVGETDAAVDQQVKVLGDAVLLEQRVVGGESHHHCLV